MHIRVRFQSKSVLRSPSDHNTPDIKPSNILVNYSTSATRFSDIQLADLGDSLPIDSEYLKEGEEMGTPVFRAPEAQLSLALGPPMDIWSFGATVSYPLYNND
jgi:serine/threonine protein kinase